VILFNDAMIKRGEITEKIKKWTVWFRVPWGLCETMDEAVKVCKAKEYDPELAIIPVPVAVSGSTHEVVEHGG
jgi:hypothetical protein